MNEKIKEHVRKYCEKKGWPTTDESIIETIITRKRVWSGNADVMRWWINWFSVVEIDGMLIGFNDALTTGDDSPSDKGWEFDPSSICEVVAKEVTTTIYERK